MNQLLVNCMLIAGPILITALVVGLLISIIQVATQLQESTLSYVPKVVACSAVLVLLGPWLVGRMTAFALAMIAIIPQLG